MSDEPSGGKAPIFVVKVPADSGEPRTFYTVSELQEWATEELASWDWLNNVGQPVGNQVMNRLRAFHNATRTLDAENPQLGEVRNAVQQLYAHLGMYTADSPMGQFIPKLREDHGDEVAAGAMAYFLPNAGDIPWQNRRAVKGVQLATRFETGYYDSAESERRSLGAMRARWEQTLTAHDARARELSETLDELADECEKAVGDIRLAGAKEVKAARTSHERLREDSVQRLTQLEETFREKLALQAPVEYWQSKRREHRRATIALGVGTVIAMTVVAMLLLEGVVTLVGVTDPPWWQLGVLGVEAVLGFWFIRIVVRLFLSNLHLGSDAAERAIMLNVYLSLMEDERSGVTEEDRRLILQALFRPSATCIVRDDAAPPGIIELVTRTVK